MYLSLFTQFYFDALIWCLKTLSDTYCEYKTVSWIEVELERHQKPTSFIGKASHDPAEKWKCNFVLDSADEKIYLGMTCLQEPKLPTGGAGGAGGFVDPCVFPCKEIHIGI